MIEQLTFKTAELFVIFFLTRLKPWKSPTCSRECRKFVIKSVVHRENRKAYKEWHVIESIVIDVWSDIGRTIAGNWLANIVLLTVTSTYERCIFNGQAESRGFKPRRVSLSSSESAHGARINFDFAVRIVIYLSQCPTIRHAAIKHFSRFKVKVRECQGYQGFDSTGEKFAGSSWNGENPVAELFPF